MDEEVYTKNCINGWYCKIFIMSEVFLTLILLLYNKGIKFNMTNFIVVGIVQIILIMILMLQFYCVCIRRKKYSKKLKRDTSGFNSEDWSKENNECVSGDAKAHREAETLITEKEDASRESAAKITSITEI